jgi:hypothetical protein
MLSPEYDLRFLGAGIEQLESYLLSTDIYRPIGIRTSIGETPYPQLTLGNLLLAQKRAQATVQTQSQRLELNRISQELETSQSHWWVAWGKKANAEFKARLNLWKDFLEEYNQYPESNFDRYGYEVGRRVLLKILSTKVDKLEVADRETSSDLDRFLRTVFLPGDFIWEAKLAASFPETDFWYLYGELKRSF